MGEIIFWVQALHTGNSTSYKNILIKYLANTVLILQDLLIRIFNNFLLLIHISIYGDKMVKLTLTFEVHSEGEDSIITLIFWFSKLVFRLVLRKLIERQEFLVL